MPDAPEENDQHDSFQIPQGESGADREQKNWGKNEAPAKTFEERAVAVGADHSRQMVSHRAERGHEKINVLCAPARLREREHRHEQQRRPDVENEIAPTIQNPQIPSRNRRRNGRDGLRTGEGADLLHLVSADRSSQMRKKSTLFAATLADESGAILLRPVRYEAGSLCPAQSDAGNSAP